MRSIFIILTFFVALTAYPQKGERPKNLPKFDNRPIHFGFTLGFNSMDFSIHQSNSFLTIDSLDKIDNNRQIGFNIHIVSNIRLGEYFDVRFLPGLSFGQRDIDYSFWSPTKKSFVVRKMKLESTFIDFPFLLKYKAKRINNYRPYLVGGTNLALDLASQKTIKEEDKPKIRLKPFDVYYQLGFGIDYYLTFFKFSTEITFAVGMLDILKKDDTKYTQAIDKMNSKVVMINFHFE